MCSHVRFGDVDVVNPGLGRKPDDARVVPLCRTCHERQHRGREGAFWEEVGIDPAKLAEELYKHTGDLERCQKVVKRFSRLRKSRS